MKLRRAAAALLTPLLFAGCAGANIALHSTNSPSLAGSAPLPGSAYSYNSVGLQAEVSPGAYFGMMFLGYLMMSIQDNFRSRSYGAASRQPPEMAEDRAVVERDCTQPLEPLHANLRCK